MRRARSGDDQIHHQFHLRIHCDGCDVETEEPPPSDRASSLLFLSTLPSFDPPRERKLRRSRAPGTEQVPLRLIRACRLHEAQRMFDGLHRRNTVTWNTMIAAHIRNRDVSRARRLFDGMPERDPVSWNTMLSGYAGFAGYFEEARTLFDRMPERDAVSWNTMIAACSRNGRTGEAARLFKAMPGRNAVSWNTLMMGFLENGEVEKAVEVFRGIPSRDSSSLSALVRGLARNNMLGAAEVGLLGLDFTRDGALDAYNTLIAAYGQRGMVMEARQMFDRIPHIHKNAVSWNSMSMCYVKTGDLSAARAMFNETPQKDCVSMFN
ncbi:hypothetical protein QJS04_geneDACA023991 [Acorus gramineus]|uniref:Pentatricopeptide repeat-containing protein n=1 Tax=Acorus gramineus TaxID=55184 RepID=A0AAV9A855_ACOGR|nr:hypothetical protein QJS04_geneDACA023991 [Acorus gramineus]